MKDKENSMEQEAEKNIKKDDVASIQDRWAQLLLIIKEQFKKEADVDALLFLIGIRELGKGPETFTKEQKVDLMHIAICAILAPDGYYKLQYLDQEGWPHWKQVKELPFIDVFSQEVFLKSHIIDYFAPIYDI